MSTTLKTRDERVQGSVLLRVLMGTDGTVQKVRIIKGLPYGLSYQAMEAAYRVLFKPATKDGQAVLFWQIIEVTFELKQR